MTEEGRASRSRRRTGWRAAFVTALVVLSGCSGKGEYGTVRGLVTFNGQAISEGMVVFFSPETCVYQAARIQPDGSFVAKMSDGPGLLVGEYQVAVMPPVVEGPGSKAFGPISLRDYREIPIKYRNPKTSGLTLSVTPGENRLFVIDMKP